MAPPYGNGNGMCAMCAPSVIPLCFCPAGFYCDANSSEYPGCERCPAGFYCPIPGDRVPPLPCPSGYFCPESTFIPVKCQSGSVCSSTRQFYLVGPFMCLLVLFVLYLPTLWRKYHIRPKSEVPLEERKSLTELDAAQSVTVELEEVKVTIGGCGKPSKTILDITGRFQPGTLTAVMGPSGAGKTTLLTVLKGGLTPSAGNVFVNGKKTNLAKFRKSTGYAPQDDDTVDPDLTVREALFLSARLRLPRHVSQEHCRHAVERVMAVLGLLHVAESVIGTGEVHEAGARGISGGERKRVNIGMELVALPSCLLVDEPTSGLDSVSAANVIEHLKLVARTQVTVVATIHQPNQRIFSTFDSLLLLVDGKVAYWGEAAQAGRYFNSIGAPVLAHTAVADMIMDFVSNNKELVLSKYQGEEMKGRTAPTGRLITRVTPYFPFQLLVQTHRMAKRALRQANQLILALTVFGFSGIYLGVSFVAPKFVLPIPSEIANQCPEAVRDISGYERWNRPCATDWPNSEVQGLAAMFFCMGVGTVAASFSVKTLGQDRPLFWRETASGVSPFASIVAKYVVDVVYIALFSLFFVSGYFFVASPFGAFYEYFFLTCAEIWVCFGLGYLTSSLFDAQNAAILAMTLSLVAGVFSGFVFQPSSPMWTFYYSEGLFRSEIQYVIDHAQAADQPYIQIYAKEVYDYGIGDDVIGNDIGMLLLWGLGFRFVSALIMRVNHLSKMR